MSIKVGKNIKVRVEGYYWVRLRSRTESGWGLPTVAQWEGGLWHTCGSEMDAESENVAVVEGPIPMPLVDGLYWVQWISPKGASNPEVAQRSSGRWYVHGEEEPVDAKLVHVVQGPIELTGRLNQPLKPTRGSAT